MIKVRQLLGVTGIDPNERITALRWAERLQWPVLLVAIWIPIQWYLEEVHAISLTTAHYFDWAIWLIFLLETALITTLARDKWRYLCNNWMNLLIIFGGFPIVWTETPLVGALRNLRLMIMLFLIFRVSPRFRKYLAQGQVGPTLLVTSVIVMLSGIIVSHIDPSIGNAWDGMWWAWVTISHTGYGDIVPISGAGRFFGALVILLGVVLVSLLTANLSAFLIGSEVKKVEKEEKQVDVQLKQIAERLENIERLLNHHALDNTTNATRDDVALIHENIQARK
ncbi:MAG: ion transporter [Methylophilaceae bacterium]|nr:ion transporter [Methylophilaceae bacterium]